MGSKLEVLELNAISSLKLVVTIANNTIRKIENNEVLNELGEFQALITTTECKIAVIATKRRELNDQTNRST